MSNFAKLVVEQNNRGALHIQNGQLDQAMSAFQEALVHLKQVSDTCDEPFFQLSSSDFSSNCSTDDAASSFLSGPCLNFLDNGTQPPTSTSCPPSNHRERFLFRDPIQIQQWQQGQVLDCNLLINQLSVIILYNLALSIQLQVMMEQEQQLLSSTSSTDQQQQQQQQQQKHQYDLEKACKILEYALLQHRIGGGSHVNVVQTCALMNNLGQVYWMLHHLEHSKKCFGRLLNVLMYIVATASSGDQKEVDKCKLVPQYYLDCFLAGVLDLILEGSITAAGA
jgi:tetratricopeptide (TPR) repeat protein